MWGVHPRQLEIVVGSSLLGRHWEPNSGPLQDLTLTLLTTKPSLQPSARRGGYGTLFNSSTLEAEQAGLCEFLAIHGYIIRPCL